MKRAALKRKTPLKRTGFKPSVASGGASARQNGLRTVSRTAEKDDTFMAQFRGLPCVLCERTWFLRDENGRKILTAGHHLLEKSTHPEYRYNPNGVVPVCGDCHRLADEDKAAFTAELKVKCPKAYDWYMEHNHHRKG